MIQNYLKALQEFTDGPRLALADVLIQVIRYAATSRMHSSVTDAETGRVRASMLIVGEDAMAMESVARQSADKLRDRVERDMAGAIERAAAQVFGDPGNIPPELRDLVESALARVAEGDRTEAPVPGPEL